MVTTAIENILPMSHHLSPCPIASSTSRARVRLAMGISRMSPSVYRRGLGCKEKTDKQKKKKTRKHTKRYGEEACYLP